MNIKLQKKGHGIIFLNNEQLNIIRRRWMSGEIVHRFHLNAASSTNNSWH